MGIQNTGNSETKREIKTKRELRNTYYSSKILLAFPRVTRIKSNYRMTVCWFYGLLPEGHYPLIIITSHLTYLQDVNLEYT